MLSNIKNNDNPFYLETWFIQCFIFGGILVIILFVTLLFLGEHIKWLGPKAMNLEKIGQFGDFIGGLVGSFWAFAGVLLFYKSLNYQKDQLSDQKEELQLQRNEFTIQNKTFRLQRFENTFFSLLNLHHQIIEGIDLEIEVEKIEELSSKMVRSTFKGRDVFKEKFNDLQAGLIPSFGDFQEDYQRVYLTVQTDFGHYFRNLYRIIKFVDQFDFWTKEEIKNSSLNETENNANRYEELNFKEKYKYTSMVRAQLSNFELTWLFYNCLSTNGVEKFKPLIEKYTLLKNLPKDEIRIPGILDKYSKTAYSKKNQAVDWPISNYLKANEVIRNM